MIPADMAGVVIKEGIPPVDILLFLGNVLQFESPGGADEDTSSTLDTCIGGDLKGRAYLLLHAPIHQADSGYPYYIAAGTDAEAAQDTIIGRESEARLGNAKFGGKGPNQWKVFARSHEEFHRHPARTTDHLRVGMHDCALLARVGTGGN